MTTVPLISAPIRRILGDAPDLIDLAASVTSSTTVYTTTALDIGKVGVGNILEHDDGYGDVVRVISTDPANLQFTVSRAHGNSTAVSHSDVTFLTKNPRFLFNTIEQAVNTVIDVDLYNEGVLDLNEHQITSSSTTTAYNAPTSLCEEFLSVAQKTSSMTEPLWITDYDRLPRNIDTSLYANGRVFFIRSNLGIAGTDLYYVTCAHRHTITSLNARVERIVQWLACAYLLEWTEPRREAGPTNQGDRTVRPGQAIATAAYYRELAARAIAKERTEMRKLVPAQKIFRRA